MDREEFARSCWGGAGSVEVDEAGDGGDCVWDCAVWKEEADVETTLVRLESRAGEVVLGIESAAMGVVNRPARSLGWGRYKYSEGDVSGLHTRVCSGKQEAENESEWWESRRTQLGVE